LLIILQARVLLPSFEDSPPFHPVPRPYRDGELWFWVTIKTMSKSEKCPAI